MKKLLIFILSAVVVSTTFARMNLDNVRVRHEALSQAIDRADQAEDGRSLKEELRGPGEPAYFVGAQVDRRAVYGPLEEGKTAYSTELGVDERPTDDITDLGGIWQGVVARHQAAREAAGPAEEGIFEKGYHYFRDKFSGNSQEQEITTDTAEQEITEEQLEDLERDAYIDSGQAAIDYETTQAEDEDEDVFYDPL